MRKEVMKTVVLAALLLVLGAMASFLGVAGAERRATCEQDIHSAKSDIESLTALADEYRRLKGRSPSTLEDVVTRPAPGRGEAERPRGIVSPWGDAYGLRVDHGTGRPIVWCAVPARAARRIHVIELSSGTNWEAVLEDMK